MKSAQRQYDHLDFTWEFRGDGSLRVVVTMLKTGYVQAFDLPSDVLAQLVPDILAKVAIPGEALP